MKKWIRQLLEAIGWIPRTEFDAEFSKDYPDQASLRSDILHIVGSKNYQKWAYLKCPCGCGALIMLSLSTTRHPHWNVKVDWLNRPTIKPSIWQTDGCFSHFWLTQGRVDWVKNIGKHPPLTNL